MNGGDTAYGDLHNECQDHVFPLAKLVRGENLNQRVGTLGTMIFLGFGSGGELGAALAAWCLVKC